MLAHAVGLLLLTYATSLTMVVAFAVLHGAAWGLRGPFMQALRADYFGRSAIGMILGLSYMIIILGQVGGPMIAGIFADLTGNYRVGFTLVALLVVGGVLIPGPTGGGVWAGSKTGSGEPGRASQRSRSTKTAPGRCPDSYAARPDRPSRYQRTSAMRVCASARRAETTRPR